jgi:hypothetical protein
MNEHIEAYLKQHHCRDYFNAYGETIDDDHYFMYREEVEGLIELVVRECAELSVNSQYANTKSEYYEGFNEALVYAGNKIRKHFGVEE